MQLQHIDVANRHLAFEALARTAIMQPNLARGIKPSLFQHAFNIGHARAIEHRRRNRDTLLQVLTKLHQLIIGHRRDIAGEDFLTIDILQLGFQFAAARAAMAVFIHQFADLTAKIGAGPTQMGFQDLPHIHARRHAKRVQHQVNRGTIFQEGHVFHRHNAADHTLIPMAAGHLVTRLKLALHRDEDLNHLHHAGRQFVTALHFFDLALKTLLQLFNRGIEFALHGFNFGHRGIIRDRDLPPCRLGKFIQHFIGDHRARLDLLETAGRLAVQQAFTQA